MPQARVYDIVNVTQENVLLSPYSASLALLMAAAGARGETRSQMLAGLHIQDQDNSDCWQSSFPYIRDDGFYSINFLNPLKSILPGSQIAI